MAPDQVNRNKKESYLARSKLMVKKDKFLPSDYFRKKYIYLDISRTTPARANLQWAIQCPWQVPITLMIKSGQDQSNVKTPSNEKMTVFLERSFFVHNFEYCGAGENIGHHRVHLVNARRMMTSKKCWALMTSKGQFEIWLHSRSTKPSFGLGRTCHMWIDASWCDKHIDTHFVSILIWSKVLTKHACWPQRTFWGVSDNTLSHHHQ